MNDSVVDNSRLSFAQYLSPIALLGPKEWQVETISESHTVDGRNSAALGENQKTLNNRSTKQNASKSIYIQKSDLVTTETKNTNLDTVAP